MTVNVNKFTLFYTSLKCLYYFTCLGESRYDCFNSSMQTNELQRDAVTGEQGQVLNMDDFDPVNDVEDFVGETHHVSKTCIANFN